VLIGLFLSLFLSGCIPARYVYYEPVAVGGEIYHSNSGITFGKDTIEFTYNDVKIRCRGESTGFYLTVLIPKGLSIRFVSNDLKWYLTESSKNKIRAPFFLTYWNSWKNERINVQPSDILVQRGEGALSLPEGPASGIYENYIKLCGTHIDQYYIKLPDIEINDEVFDIPVVKFMRKDSFGFFPINDG
jgi:hypothetical protein